MNKITKIFAVALMMIGFSSVSVAGSLSVAETKDDPTVSAERDDLSLSTVLGQILLVPVNGLTGEVVTLEDCYWGGLRYSAGAVVVDDTGTPHTCQDDDTWD